nr:hypothetical protein [uncultured Dongia sp.]
MSYARMDHAGWVEKNNVAGKRLMTATQRKSDRGFATAPDQLSPFQVKVMDILGMVGGGIYNAPIVWESIDWGRPYSSGKPGAISVSWRGHLATFDFNQLTRLVFLCHEARIRCALSPWNPGHLRLSFSSRTDEDGFSDGHPSLDEAVTTFRDYLPAEHRIIYIPASTKAGA